MLRTSSWWSQKRLEDRLPFLKQRQLLVRDIKNYFLTHDFIEVETPVLQLSPGLEPHLHAFATHLIAPDGHVEPLYLRTSPEFSCKKLLAGGVPKIFEIARVFRNRERSTLHHPEFTMLEWYRKDEPYDALIQDCENILQCIVQMTQAPHWTWKEKFCDINQPVQRLSVHQAFLDFAEIDLFETMDDQGNTDAQALIAQAKKQNIRIAHDDRWSDVFSRILVEKIEPFLGINRPCFLVDYPVSEAALARRKMNDPRLCERFELYVCGVELANGFGELSNAQEQRRRFEEDMHLKKRLYEESYPIDDELLEALPMMGNASGVALGIDRLVMLACGATHIEQVLWAPVWSKDV